jgi:hypothetical protein
MACDWGVSQNSYKGRIRALIDGKEFKFKFKLTDD